MRRVLSGVVSEGWGRCIVESGRGEREKGAPLSLSFPYCSERLFVLRFSLPPHEGLEERGWTIISRRGCYTKADPEDRRPAEEKRGSRLHPLLSLTVFPETTF